MVLLKLPTWQELAIAAIDLETKFHQREPRARVTSEVTSTVGTAREQEEVALVARRSQRRNSRE